MVPQPGIFATGNTEHTYLEFDLRPGARAGDLGRRLASLFGDGTPLVAVSCVMGLRPELWRDIAGAGALPAGAASFAGVAGPDFSMPATQHDAWVWLAGCRRDGVFENALSAINVVVDSASVISDVTAWGHLGDRDLTGFIDGTENPTVPEAPAVVSQADGPAAGSSVLLFQQWHHSPTWLDLTVAEQEKVIGRRKADSEELAPDVIPPDSHVSRNVVEEDGKELAIYRRNTAWGTPTYHGTLFVGFCASTHPLQVMLERMAGIPDGTRDALTRYSTPLTGSYYVIPSLEALGSL